MSALLNDEELKQRLYDLFGQNFLDGDKPEEWKATTMNASEVKEYIDEFVLPLIQDQKKAHADMVIGKKIKLLSPKSFEITEHSYDHIAQNELIDEQRSRNV